MKKVFLTLAFIPLFLQAQTNEKKEINLNLELIKQGNKTRNEAIFTAAIGSAFSYWGTKRKNGKAMVFIGAAVASLSIPMTIVGNRKINKGIKKFD